MNFKKNFFWIIILLFFYSSIIFAINLQTSTNIPVLYVQVFHNGKWSGWSDQAEVSKGDKVWFHIHSYANGGDIKNLVNYLDNINNYSFLKNNTHTIVSTLKAANANKISGSVQLKFKDNLKFKYAGYKWATKLKGPNPEIDQHYKKVPFGQNGDEVLTREGVKLGNLDKDHRSNFLVFFYLEGVEPAISGNCGDIKNSCKKGKFIDIKDDNFYYKWRCLGLNGGENKNCELRKIPMDGVCSSKFNKCLKGYFNDLKDDDKYYIWKCNGLNGGKSEECKVEKKPINGVCGRSLNKCSHGSFLDIKDSHEKKFWKCRGLYGGQDINCSIQKMCPCTLNKVTDTSKINSSTIKTSEYSDYDFKKISDENIKLKLDLKSCKNPNIKNIVDNLNYKIWLNFKLWHWILLIIYTLIIVLITKLLSKKRN